MNATEARTDPPLGRRARRDLTAPPMKPETRRALIERFAPSNRTLSELSGFDLSHWLR